MGNDVDHDSELLKPHGGYGKLITYRLGLLIYDATAAFCNRYIPRKDRTYDQMVQAARSGVANIVEASEASATSKKTEIKLTNVAKASQEELLDDYKSFLRQRELVLWEADSPSALKVRKARPATLEQLRLLMKELVATMHCPDVNGVLPELKTVQQEVAANTMICLINQHTFLLARQIARLAADFEQNGGFTERLYQKRKENRD